MPSTPLRVGDLAAATGLTVRTLHHYEQLGLLAPARTDGNQRIYDADDVRRLYVIRALQELGLSLAEIGAVHARGPGSLDGVLRRHLTRVEAEIARLEAQRAQLRAAIDQADTPALLAAIEATSRVRAHVAGRDREPGAEARWRSLGDALRACLDRGDPPHAPAARALAGEIRTAIHAFAGGDPAVIGALAEIRRHDPPAALAGWDPPLFRYLEAVLAALEEG